MYSFVFQYIYVDLSCSLLVMAAAQKLLNFIRVNSKNELTQIETLRKFADDEKIERNSGFYFSIVTMVN